MPAVRERAAKLSAKENSGLQSSFFANNSMNETFKKTHADVVDLAVQSSDRVYFPATETERSLFRTADGKKISPHQWAVYDLARQIPCGKVTTYKHLCAKLGEGSPRSVGSALRNNPFAPYVPCHRIIASDLTLGGFQGEWGTQFAKGSSCSRKVEMLSKEGVLFGRDGKLASPGNVVWK